MVEQKEELGNVYRPYCVSEFFGCEPFVLRNIIVFEYIVIEPFPQMSICRDRDI